MKRLLLILLITPFLFGSSAYATKVKFFNGSFVSAKEKAATEGKLIFVDFTARWCLPCQMMDQTTFNDDLLADYIAGSFIPVKVDIDDFDGFALKEKYEIQALPSILIFNSAGQLLDRHQEAMGATKMREVLNRYDHPDNRRIISIVEEVRTRPTSDITTVPTTQPETSYRPPLGTTAPAPYTPSPAPAPVPNHPVPAPVPTYPAPVVEAPAPVYVETTPIEREPVPNAAPEVMPAGQGLFRFSVSRQPSAGYSVQIGAFGHYGNVLTEVEKLQSKVDAPILVNIGTLRGKTVYKVLIGEFMNRQDAIDFSNYLKGIQIDGIIKDLRLMQ